MKIYAAKKHRVSYILLSLLFLFVASCASVHDGLETTGKDETASSPANNAGIELISIRLTAAAHMLDFRYKVTDPAKAKPIFDRSTIPYLVHEKSGAKFAIPNPAKIGPMRATTRKPEVGRVYFMFFANPARYVKKGDLVSVMIGDNRFEHLRVE